MASHDRTGLHDQRDATKQEFHLRGRSVTSL
jgi:hypothetical protein